MKYLIAYILFYTCNLGVSQSDYKKGKLRMIDGSYIYAVDLAVNGDSLSYRDNTSKAIENIHLDEVYYMKVFQQL